MLKIIRRRIYVIPEERLKLHYGDMSWVVFVTILVLVFIMVMIFVSLVSLVYILKNYKTLRKTSSSSFEKRDLAWLGLGIILVIIVTIGLVTINLLRLSW